MLGKDIGKVHVRISPDESLAFIERLDDPGQVIQFHLEADWFRDIRDWEEGFRLEEVADGVVVQNSSQRLHLSEGEFAAVNRYFIQYRQGMPVV